MSNIPHLDFDKYDAHYYESNYYVVERQIREFCDGMELIISDSEILCANAHPGIPVVVNTVFKLECKFIDSITFVESESEPNHYLISLHEMYRSPLS